MTESYTFDYPDYQWNLFYLFAHQHDAVAEIAPEAFKETLYMKMYKEKFWKEPKKNPWQFDVRNFKFIERDSAPIHHANEDFHDKIVDSVLVAAHCKSVPYVWVSTFEQFVFVLTENYMKIYKSKFKAFLPWSLIWLLWLAEAAINSKKRQEKSVTCDTFLKEDFLSNLTYNSYMIEEHVACNVEFKIKIWKKEFICDSWYQPFFHIFLYFVKNWFKKKMTKNEIKRAILAEYVYWDKWDSPEKITASVLPKKRLFL